MEEMTCPKCKKDHIIKIGFAPRKGGKRQRYQCVDCGHPFMKNEKEL
jgi:transposase-like protein